MRALLPLVALLCIVLGTGARAAIDVHTFDTPEQHARFEALIDELRCPKCLNTNLSGSDSAIAADLRDAVARMIREGRSDQEIRDYLVARYGDFILYKPRLNAATVLLWFGPGLLLLVGLTIIVVLVRRQLRRADFDDLSTDEVARLEALGARTGEAAETPEAPR